MIEALELGHAAKQYRNQKVQYQLSSNSQNSQFSPVSELHQRVQNSSHRRQYSLKFSGC